MMATSAILSLGKINIHSKIIFNSPEIKDREHRSNPPCAHSDSRRKEMIKLEGDGCVLIADHYPKQVRIKVSHGTS